MIGFVIWKPVVGFEGLYEVSNRGEIRSVRGAAPKMSGRVLRPGMREDGHLQVILCRDGERHTVKVHRAVAEAFLARPEHTDLVRHIDGKPTNNYVENLAWGTSQQDALQTEPSVRCNEHDHPQQREARVPGLPAPEVRVTKRAHVRVKRIPR